MLQNFGMIRSCFGPDNDEPNDSEKFEIKNKRERKISYNPNHVNHSKKKKKNNKANNSTGYNSESYNTGDEKSTKPSQMNQLYNSAKVNHRKISFDLDLNLNNFHLSDISEIKNDFDIEYDYGNKEYKLKLCNLNNERIEGLATQMKFRLDEGGGECFYLIGVEDNGNPLGLSNEELEISVEYLKKIVERLNATATITNLHKGKVGLIAEVMIKKLENEYEFCNKLEIKIGLLGEEGSGKSTLIGVLVSNKLDNGRGLARFNVFRHKHEIICGKTSSISHQILGFDENGETTNHGSLERQSWAQIVDKSSKIVNFYDMGGSNKNFKKSMTAFSPNYLDYLLLVISADRGITETTEDLLNFSANMKLPIITVFTKIDLIDENMQKLLIKNFKTIITKIKQNRVPIVMKSTDDIVLFSRNIQEKNILPIFLISNLNWNGLNLIKSFLSMLPVHILENELKSIEKEKIEFDIHETLSIEEKIIVAGIINKGKLITGTRCYLGPDNDGKYKIVEIVNIHCKKIPVKYVYKGQYCSIYIKSDSILKKEDVRKGMVLLDINSSLRAVKLFEAELWTIDGTKRVIKYKYQPVLNIKHVRQGCKIINAKDLLLGEENENLIQIILNNENINLENIKDYIDKVIEEKRLEHNNQLSVIKNPISNKITNSFNNISYNQNEAFLLTSTSKTKVIFEFMFNPEYLTIGSHIIINDQLIKAFGTITKIYK